MLCLELGMHETCSCNMVGSTTKSQVFNFYCENHSMCITYVSFIVNTDLQHGNLFETF